MQNWYRRTNVAQKIFLWLVGLAPMALLIAQTNDRIGAAIISSPPVLLLIFLQLGCFNGKKSTS